MSTGVLQMGVPDILSNTVFQARRSGGSSGLHFFDHGRQGALSTLPMAGSRAGEAAKPITEMLEAACPAVFVAHCVWQGRPNAIAPCHVLATLDGNE